ncbi:winged helix-turn-helix domain-containing protein [Cognatilysobacter tabacisoli]|uniref:winged helix-turn-helix domain-containing protein n=1 Tax=Cognatilysobacter tabacisoli TaxID=2315424 RepID=UPI000E6B02C5|nr:winged helix-turn-helix domain-containing protein [Lysobacter tabacisoli]
MAAPEPSRLSFDNVVIDFAGRRLLRDDVEQPLEPKAFGVLALLARSPGVAVPRDAILDAVWGHRHVTPGVLNRVMTLLRHALGEDAHAPRYLHTVHGVGYRFDLPQGAPAGDAAATAVGVDAPGVDAGPSGTGSSGTGSPTSAGPAADDADAASGDSGAAPFHRRAADRAPPPRTHRAAWLLVPLTVAVAVAVVAARWWPNERPAARAPAAASLATAEPTLVVMPLKAIGDDAGARVLAEGLSEELIGNLARIDGLRVIARESSSLAAGDRANLVARLGVSHALEGSLQQADQRLRVRLRLVEADTGRALWARDFDRDAAEVLLLQREIAEAVAASLALKLGLAAAPARSGDADFLRRYLAARALIGRRDLTVESSSETAESELRALLRERPDDARVHAALALALEIRAQRRPSVAPVLRQDAAREAAIALRLDPRLPEPYAVLGSADCIANRWERCVTLLERARALAPSEPGLVYLYTSALARLGYLDRAEAIARETLRRDPINPVGHFQLGRLLDTLGRHDEARAHLDRTAIDGAYARWFNAVWRRDYAAALRIAEREIGAPDHPDPYAARLAPGYAAASRAFADPALWPQAIDAFARFDRVADRPNFFDVLRPDAPSRAAQLIATLDEVRRRGYSSWDLLLWTRDYAFLRRDPAFQRYLRDSGILAYWRRHGFPPQCRPQGDGARCE